MTCTSPNVFKAVATIKKTDNFYDYIVVEESRAESPNTIEESRRAKIFQNSESNFFPAFSAISLTLLINPLKRGATFFYTRDTNRIPQSSSVMPDRQRDTDSIHNFDLSGVFRRIFFISSTYPFSTSESIIEDSTSFFHLQKLLRRFSERERPTGNGK